jgi:hypoxanthine phosphoribosyltransferase
MKKAAIYFNYNRKYVLSNELTERSLKEYAERLPDAKVVAVYTDISGKKFSEAKLNFFNWMIEDIRARGIEILVVDDVSNLVSLENCWCPIEKLRKMGIKVISLPTARISAKDHIIFKEPKQKKKSSMTHQKMREEWYKDLREHHKCVFESLVNKK